MASLMSLATLEPFGSINKASNIFVGRSVPEQWASLALFAKSGVQVDGSTRDAP